MSLRIEEAMDVLERTPAFLKAWLEGLPRELLEADEGPDTFSPHDVVSHLVHGEEEDWVPRARIILEHGEAVPFEPFERFAFRERNAGRTTVELLARFAELRAESLRAIRELELGAADLLKTGMHPELGRVTLAELLATWAVHDQAHTAQIARVLGKHFGEHVGAWRAYINLLSK
jgi:hypothetical protein